MSKSNPTTKEKVQKWMDDAIICHMRLRYGPYGCSDSSIMSDHYVHVSYKSVRKIRNIMELSEIQYVHRYTKEELDKDPNLRNYLYEAYIMYKGWKFFGIISEDTYNKIMADKGDG